MPTAALSAKRYRVRKPSAARRAQCLKNPTRSGKNRFIQAKNRSYLASLFLGSQGEPLVSGEKTVSAPHKTVPSRRIYFTLRVYGLLLVLGHRGVSFDTDRMARWPRGHAPQPCRHATTDRRIGYPATPTCTECLPGVPGLVLRIRLYI